MKILYDHQIYQDQRVGGVSRYFTEIIKHLPEDVQAEISVEYSFNEYLKDTDFPFQYVYQLQNKIYPDRKFKGQAFITGLLEKYFSGKYPNRYEINKQKTIEKIKRGDFDIFHPTFFDDYYLNIMNGKPFVLTVHDMVLELYPELAYSLGFVKRKKKLIDKAAHIIAVSENTKKDLINIFDVDPDRISVTYHASSLVQAESSGLDLPKKYILYVGDRRMGYKNFNYFVMSIIPVLQKYQDVDLLCVGGGFTPNEISFFNELGIKERVKQLSVSDQDLYTVYNKAEMMVYPSYYEGFGIPIVEAFQARCPVVLADASCFREVAGDAAIYFQPKAPNQLRSSIVSLLDNRTLREEYIRKGGERLKKYSWKQSAQTTADIYKKVLENWK